jgi:hypothetical protein
LSFSRRRDRNEELFLGVREEEVGAGGWLRDKTEYMGKGVVVVVAWAKDDRERNMEVGQDRRRPGSND